MWGIGGLVSPHDLRVHNHNDILVLKRFYFKLNKKISLSVSQCSFFKREHNNILPPKFPKFPATQGALTISDNNVGIGRFFTTLKIPYGRFIEVSSLPSG